MSKNDFNPSILDIMNDKSRKLDGALKIGSDVQSDY